MTPTKNTCLRGHNISEVGRYRGGGQCKACERARVAKWKLANRDQVNLQNREYARVRRDLYRQLFGVSYVPNRPTPGVI